MPNIKKIETKPSAKGSSSKSPDKKPVKKPTTAKPKLAKTAKPSSGGASKKASKSADGGNKRTKICASIADWVALGVKEPSRDQVALLADYVPKSAGFLKALGILKKEGMIAYGASNTLTLTEAGKREAPHVEPPKTNAETLERFLSVYNKGSKGETKADLLCQCLADGQPHSTKEAAKACGYEPNKLSGFAKVVGKLSTFGLVDRDKKMLVLADIAFPYGRPGADAAGNTESETESEGSGDSGDSGDE
ncbi:hypothetical protein MPSEU_000750200 [Mayamaea pseudoterrestris]|nr:hypothetical protein MPSEU_000750200 [Mayamaea pseudoterrestris]